MSAAGPDTERCPGLLDALDGLVPLLVLEMRDWPFERRRAALDVEAINSCADELMFGARLRRTARSREASVRALNAIARGLPGRGCSMTTPWRLGDRDPVLTETLRFALALHEVEMRGLSAAERYRRVPRDAAALVGSRGDALQWRGKSGQPSPGTAATFNALAAGMAALAGEDGGVTALGVHACAHDHDGCPNTRTTEVADGRHEP